MSGSLLWHEERLGRLVIAVIEAAHEYVNEGSIAIDGVLSLEEILALLHPMRLGRLKTRHLEQHRLVPSFNRRNLSLVCYLLKEGSPLEVKKQRW